MRLCNTAHSGLSAVLPRIFESIHARYETNWPHAYLSEPGWSNLHDGSKPSPLQSLPPRALLVRLWTYVSVGQSSSRNPSAPTSC
jgi:hypothetical protein